jgi:hypothetical protein
MSGHSTAFETRPNTFAGEATSGLLAWICMVHPGRA